MAAGHPPKHGLPYEERSEALHELDHLSKQPGVTLRQAARIVASKHGGIKAESLRQALWRHGGSVERTDVHQLLTDEQEQVLLGIIRGFSLANRALSVCQIINLARVHFKLGDQWDGTAASYIGTAIGYGDALRRNCRLNAQLRSSSSS